MSDNPIVQGQPGMLRPQDVPLQEQSPAISGASPNGTVSPEEQQQYLDNSDNPQTARNFPQIVPNVNSATRVMVTRDAFESYLRNRQITSWEEFVVRAQSFNQMETTHGMHADNTSTGVKIMTWLAIWLINMAVWGIVGLLSTLSWVFGMLGTMGYAWCLYRFILKITKEARDERESYYYKIVVDRLWCLIPVLFAVSAGYVVKNMIEPVLPETRFWGCMRLIMLFTIGIPHFVLATKIWKRHRAVSMTLNLYFGALAISMMVVDLSCDWLRIPQDKWEIENRESEARAFEGERKRATAFDEGTGMPLPPAVGSHGEVSETLNVRPDGTLVDRQTGKALNRTAAGGPAKEFMQAKTDVEATQKTPETPQSPTDNAVPSRARALGEGSNASETSAKRTRTPATGDEEVEGRAQEGGDDKPSHHNKLPRSPLDTGFDKDVILHPDRNGEAPGSGGQRWVDREKLRPEPEKWWLDYGITKDFIMRLNFFLQATFALLHVLMHAKKQTFDLDDLPEHITWRVHIAGFMFFIASFVILHLPTWKENNEDLPKWLAYVALLHFLIAVGLLFAKWRVLVLGGVGWAFIFWRTSMLVSWVLESVGFPDILQSLGGLLSICGFGTLCVYMAVKLGNSGAGTSSARVRFRQALRIQPGGVLNDPRLRHPLVNEDALEGREPTDIRTNPALA